MFDYPTAAELDRAYADTVTDAAETALRAGPWVGSMIAEGAPFVRCACGTYVADDRTGAHARTCAPLRALGEVRMSDREILKALLRRVVELERVAVRQLESEGLDGFADDIRAAQQMYAADLGLLPLDYDVLPPETP